ncbi:MAG: CRTAC1 family protein [Planctomycetota bacterium]|jgi:hypothetical protein
MHDTTGIGRAWGVTALIAAALPAIPAGGQVVLTDATAEANLIATHAPDETAIPGSQEWMTGGLAVGDFNRDGWPDIFYVGGGGQPDRLFINHAQPGMVGFTDLATDWGIADLHCGNGASVGDFDGDGWPDIYLTSFGAAGTAGQPGQHRLYRNTGTGGFENVAQDAGVNFSSISIATGYGSAWGDYDLDGDLDLFVASWMESAHGNRLYRNEGDGTFTNVTDAAIGPITAQFWGFQPAFADMDGDLYPEILIAADFEDSRYLLNNGDGTFTNLTPANGTGVDDNGMGQTVLDVTNDGILDWYVTSVHQETPNKGQDVGNMLYLGLGNHQYVEASGPTGTNDGGWGWGTTAVDLDADGWTDLVAVNGRPAKGSEWIDERAKMFYNLGGVFLEMAEITGPDSTGEGRGLVWLDADQDGDLDLAISNAGGALEFYRNDTVNAGSWLQLVFDTSGRSLLPPDGFGVRVEVDAGGQTYTRLLNGSPSYLATSEHLVHVGMGSAQLIDEVRIRWPRGQVTVLSNLGVDQRLAIVAPGAADLDANGSVEIGDLLDMLSLWGPVSSAAALRGDLDNDHEVGITDLLALLAAWTG